jgi:lipopolysaccharide transport system ATP-binding protein
MKRAEIDRKFDEIVSFAEVESFLDTPVKRYSNGMRVRLGFAVAAHLEPEVLIIDEVLSVGDAAFRKKCLEKMESVAGEGRTVLFISHNMASIRSLCPRTILLDGGRKIGDGPSDEVIAQYLGEQGDGLAERRWGQDGKPSPGSTTGRLVSARLVEPETGRGKGRFACDEPIDLEIVYRVLEPSDLFAEFHVKDAEGQRLFVAGEFQAMEWRDRIKEPGEYRIVCHLPPDFFNEGTHSIDLDLITLNPSQVQAQAPGALFFTVHDDKEVGGSRGYRIRARWPSSAVRPKFRYDFYRDGNPL